MAEKNYTPETLEEALELIGELRGDNKRFRTKNAELRDKVAELGDDTESVTTLKTQVAELQTKLTEAEGFKTKYEELNTQFEEVNTKAQKAERAATLKPILSKLGINDEKAFEIALEKLEGVEADKYEAEAKKVVEDYPFLAARSVKNFPATGSGSEKKIDTSKASANQLGAIGLKEALSNLSTNTAVQI